MGGSGAWFHTVHKQKANCLILKLSRSNIRSKIEKGHGKRKEKKERGKGKEMGERGGKQLKIGKKNNYYQANKKQGLKKR